MPQHLNNADDFEMVSVRRLKQHSKNVNQGDWGAIEESIKANGFFGALVVQRGTNEILAGNHRYAVAKSLGYDFLPVTWVDVSDEDALRILLADNRTGRLGSDDPNALAELLAELAATDKGLTGTGFDGDALDQLLSDLAGMPQSGLLADADPDAVPAAAEVETRCKPGDLWQCGTHRVLCGDCTDIDTLTKLFGGTLPDACITDPPYNVDLDYDDATDDKKNRAEYARFSQQWWGCIPCSTRVVTPGWNNLAFWLNSIAPQAMGVWTKTNSCTRGSVSRFNCWEPILFYGCKNTDRAHDTFDFPTGFQKETGDHPCPKPFKFWVELLSCYSDDGATVYEPFLGSGTTLMAAQETGRVCFALEHSPYYVDIAVARWERATGQTAVRID